MYTFCGLQTVRNTRTNTHKIRQNTARWTFKQLAQSQSMDSPPLNV